MEMVSLLPCYKCLFFYFSFHDTFSTFMRQRYNEMTVDVLPCAFSFFNLLTFLCLVNAIILFSTTLLFMSVGFDKKIIV